METIKYEAWSFVAERPREAGRFNARSGNQATYDVAERQLNEVFERGNKRRNPTHVGVWRRSPATNAMIQLSLRDIGTCAAIFPGHECPGYLHAVAPRQGTMKTRGRLHRRFGSFPSDDRHSSIWSRCNDSVVFLACVFERGSDVQNSKLAAESCSDWKSLHPQILNSVRQSPIQRPRRVTNLSTPDIQCTRKTG